MLPHQFRDNTAYQLRSSYGMRMTPFSLGNIILLKEKGEWESQFLGRLIRSSGPPRGRKGSGTFKVEIGGLEFSRRRKGQFFFPLHSLVLVNYTIQFKLCTRDYTTMYPAGGQFLLPENLLTNPDILECVLWDRVWRIFLLLNSNLVILKCKLWE